MKTISLKIPILLLLLHFGLLFGVTVGIPEQFAHLPEDSLPKALWECGFWEARIDSTHGDTAYVSIGRPAMVSSARIEIDDSLFILVIPKMRFRPGDTLQSSEIEFQQDLFITALETNGYPFASCTTAFEIGDRLETIPVKVIFNIDPGEKVIIERLEVDIDGITKASVIEHFMLFKSGGLYRRDIVQKGVSRLRRPGIVSTIGEPYPALDASGVWTLVVKCKDIPATSVTGLLGYADDDISGDLAFSTRNLLGTGRLAEFSIYAAEEIRIIELSYREPCLWSVNISPQIASRWEVRDSSYIKRAHELGIFFPLGFELDGYFGFSTTRTVPGNSENYILHGESFALEASMEFSTLDDPVLPTEGIFVSGGATAEYLHYWSDIWVEDDDGDDREFGSQTEAKLLFAHRWKKLSFWFEVSGWGWLSPTFPPESDWGYLGGWENLRGYREQQFTGVRLFHETFEPRFMPVEGVHIFPFADIGCFRDYENWHTKYSYGAGIEYRYGAGVFSIEYGIGQERTIRSGLLHFGIRMKL